MTETLENPVIKDDAFEAQLREAAEAADRGDSFELSSAEQSETRTPDTTETEPTTSSPDTKTEPDKKTGEDIPEAERKPAEPVEKVEPSKPETPEKEDSAYVKAKKNQERLNRNRQEFEEEKRRERAAIESERQRLAQERAQLQQQAQQRQPSPHQPKPPSSQELEWFASECTRKAQAAKEAGDYEELAKQSALAVEATQAAVKAREYEQGAEYEQAATTYEQLWAQDMNERIRQEPDLAKPDTELSKTVQSLMGEYPGVFERIPPIQLPSGKVMGGFSFASEIAKLRQKAGLASGLEEQLKQVTKERDELRAKTAIDGSGPTSPSPKKSIDEMGDDEAEAVLRRMSEGAVINF